MDRRISPTVRRRRLASELRRLRAEAGIKAADVATELGCSPGKISLMETCRVAISVPDAKAMLELYGVTGARRDGLVDLARAAKQRGWWLPYRTLLHPWHAQLIGLEMEAATVRGYAAELIPDLLRTEAYHRGVLDRAAERRSTEDITELVALAARRQEILEGADPPRVAFVLNEGVLRRQAGSTQAMLAQLSRLVELGKRETVSIRVLPFSAGAHAAMTGPFLLLDFPEPRDETVVYLEYLTGAHYIEGDEETKPFRRTLETLAEVALSPARTAALIRTIMQEL